MRKYRGGIEYLGSIILICFTGILMLFVCECKHVKLCQIKLRDGVDCSLLSAAVVDAEALNKTGTIVIDDIRGARRIFEEALIDNLNLNNDFEPKSTSTYEKINVNKFYIYSLVNSKYILKYKINSDYTYDMEMISYDETQTTPDGNLIKGETLYVDVGIYVNSYWGGRRYEHITSCVDIVER